jgi:hypothetical protein
MQIKKQETVVTKESKKAAELKDKSVELESQLVECVEAVATLTSEKARMDAGVEAVLQTIMVRSAQLAHAVGVNIVVHPR